MSDNHEHTTFDYALLESAYFNWRCIICSVLAQSPLHLEMQHTAEYGPYTDIDGQKWIKCDKCENPYHVSCLLEEPKVGPYACAFMQCK